MDYPTDLPWLSTGKIGLDSVPTPYTPVALNGAESIQFLGAGDMQELKAVVSRQMKYYNLERRHSSPGYASPMAYTESVLSDEKEQSRGAKYR